MNLKSETEGDPREGQICARCGLLMDAEGRCTRPTIAGGATNGEEETPTPHAAAEMAPTATESYYWAGPVSTSDYVWQPSGNGGCRHRHRTPRTAEDCLVRASRPSFGGVRADAYQGRSWRYSDHRMVTCLCADGVACELHD